MRDLLQASAAAHSHLEQALEARLRLTHPKPRIIRLCDRIGLGKKEEVAPSRRPSIISKRKKERKKEKKRPIHEKVLALRCFLFYHHNNVGIVVMNCGTSSMAKN